MSESGTAQVKLRPGMTPEQRAIVGRTFMREFGEDIGARLLIAGVSLEVAYKLAEVGLFKPIEQMRCQ